MGKKPNVKNLNKQNKRGMISSIAFALLALVLTVVVFAGLVYAENALTDNIVYKEVVVAKSDIPENEIVTEANMNQYFTIKSVNVLDATSDSIANLNPVMGMRTKVALLKDEIVTTKDFENIESYTNDIENPIEVSIDIGHIANADAGKLRAGDVVNLSFMYSRTQLNLSADANYTSYPTVNTITNTNWDEFGDDDFAFDDEEEVDVENKINYAAPTSNDNNYVLDYYSKYVLENLYIKAVYDTSGTEISPADKESSATILVFVIDKSQESLVNDAISNCNGIRISKVIQKVNKSTEDVVPTTEEEVAETSEETNE